MTSAATNQAPPPEGLRVTATQHVERVGEHGPVVVIDPGGVAPVSAVYLWLGRGAAAESSDELGAAHLLEHMLFKGAQADLPSAAAGRIESLGGDVNAYTAYEQTVLHATVPAGCEAEVIDILSEMAFAPVLAPEALAREQDVVVAEIRGALDDPADLLAEALRARALAGHPYGRAILGREDTVRKLDAAALRAFHERHHRPERAILVVAGPVDCDEIMAAARASLWSRVAAAGELGESDSHVPSRPPPQTQAGVFLLPGFEERLVELAWPAPGLRHPDQAALDLLAMAVGGGDSALLQRVLRDGKELAIDSWAALETEPDCGLFVAGAQARRGQVAACAQEILRVIDDVRMDGVPPASLRRARSTVLASRLYDRETVDGRAHRLAWYQASFGDTGAEAVYDAQIRAVRVDDLVRVARTWLRSDALVVGAVAPTSELTETDLASALQSVPSSSPRALSSSPRAPSSSPRALSLALGGLQKRRLRCGARVVVQPDSHAEVASISVVGVGGLLAEGRQQGGLAGAWSQVVTRGAGDLSAADLTAAVEDRAGLLRAWRARNSLGFEARFPGAELDLGVGLLAQVLTRPHFPDDEVRRAVADLDEARQSLLQDDPSGLAWRLAFSSLYPGHPWGRSSLGTPSSIARISASGLRRYHRRCVVGANLVLALSGNVDADEICDRLDRALASLGVGQAWQPRPPAPLVARPRHRRRVMDREQTHLVMAFPALGHGDDQVAAQRLLEGVLSGQSGRLFIELREERGLAYSVDAAAVEGLGAGTLVISAAVDPDRVAEARASLWSTLQALCDQPVDEEELTGVKARVVDGAVLGLQRSSDRAGLLAAAERYGPGAEHWRAQLDAPRAVTAVQLHHLARRLLRPERCAVVQVGPA